MWAHVQDTPGAGAMTQAQSVTSLQAGAFASANTLGNYIIVWCGGSLSGVNITGVTDNAQTPNTYTQLFLSVNGNVKIAAYIAKITSLPASGNLNPKVTLSGSGSNVNICAAEFSGGSTTMDGSAVTVQNAGSTSFTGGPISTTQQNDLLVAGFTQDDNPVGTAAPSGFTAVGIGSGGASSEAGGGAYKIVTGTVSSQAATWTASSGSSANFATGVAALQPNTPGGLLLRGVGA